MLNGPITLKQYTIVALLLTLVCGPIAFADESAEFEILAQPAAKGLNLYAEQAEMQILFPYAAVKDVETNEVVGELDKDIALNTLLADTGLEVVRGRNNTATVRSISAVEDDQTPGKSQPASSQVLMAQNQTPAQQSETSNSSETTNDEEGEDVTPLDEIIVVGSNIRGVKNDSSPIFTFDREEIDAAGFSTVPQFIQSLPQVFPGMYTEIGVGDVGGLGNVGQGVAVDLRGLGPDATLTLLNGHRMVAPGGEFIADVSMIPLVAVERVEMLTDGASAVYGSDAIAGVVNFILRDDFEGAETRLRYGDSTGGGAEELQFSQAFGKTWKSGNVVLSYEHHDRDPIDSSDRSFTKDALGPHEILGSQKRDSIFLLGKQELSDRIGLYADAFYSQREFNRVGFAPRSNRSSDSARETEAIGTNLGTTIGLGGSWQAEFVGGYNRTEIGFDNTSTSVSTGSVSNSTGTLASKVWSISGTADGALFHIPGGDVKVALGGDFHNELFINGFPSSLGIPNGDRDVSGIFGQMFIPVVGADNRRPGIERLEINLSIRYEDYSDFGDTTNWKAGVLWSPVNALNLRSSYGTSFRAPRFLQLVGIVQGILDFAPDTESPTGTSLALRANVSNAALQPETAKLWTAGFDIQPPSIPGLEISLTFFDIDFTDKIATPGVRFEAINDPDLQVFVDRMPDPNLMVEIMSSMFSFDLSGGADPADTEVFVDNRLTNFASVDTSGIDLTVSYSLDTSLAHWVFTLGGSHLIEQKQKILPTDPATNQLNNVGRPVDLKLRGGVSWTNNRGLSVNTFVNYIDGYQDTRPFLSFFGFEEGPVSSWTTVASNISYDTGDLGGFFGDMVLSLNIQNLFDTDPPYVPDISNSNNINYDPANAQPLGQYVSFQITKNW